MRRKNSGSGLGGQGRRANPSPSEEIIQRVINETIAAEDGDDAYASPGVIESDMLGNPRSCSKRSTRPRANPGTQALVNFDKPGDAVEALGELFNLARTLARDPSVAPKDAARWQIVSVALSRCRENLLDRLGSATEAKKNPGDSYADGRWIYLEKTSRGYRIREDYDYEDVDEFRAKELGWRLARESDRGSMIVDVVNARGWTFDFLHGESKSSPLSKDRAAEMTRSIRRQGYL